MAATAAATTPAHPSAARVKRIGKDALYLLLGFCSAIVAFTVWITGVTLSLSLGLLIIGFPIIVLTFAAFRLLADLERRRAALVLGEPLTSDYKPWPRGRISARLRAATLDPQTWKDFAYLALFSLVGFTWGVIWASLWAPQVKPTRLNSAR